MPDTAKDSTERSALIDQCVTELSLLVKEHCPNAAVEVTFTRYEDEDAHIFVFVPRGIVEREMETLQEVLTDRSVQILLDKGLLILVGVYEAAQDSPTAAFGQHLNNQ
jgi:hypothetical protein